MLESEPQSPSDCAPKSEQDTAVCSAKESQEGESGSNPGKAAEQSKDTELLAASSKKTSSCRFFKKSGSCHYGDKCRFAHKIPEKSTEPEVLRSDGSSGAVGAENGSKKEGKEVCRFYSRSGWCRNGRRCRFLHEKLKVPLSNDAANQDAAAANSQDSPEDGTVEEAAAKTKPSDGSEKKKKPKPKKACRYFKAGNCHLGSRCKFLHPETDRLVPSIGAHIKTSTTSQEPRPAMERPSIIKTEQVSMRIKDLQEEDVTKLRETEITQLLKRFPKDQVTVKETEDAEVVYRVVIKPTDPDWPFDIQDFEFEVSFPARYPLDPFAISMPEDQVLPNVVLQSMSTSIAEWVLARHGTNQISGKVELMFRPFLRWLDRSLERLFTDAAKKFKMEVDAKAAGIELIPYAKQKPAEMREIKLPSPSEGEIISGVTSSTSCPDAANNGPSADTSTEATPSEETSNIQEADGRQEETPPSEREVSEAPSGEPGRKVDLSNVQRKGTEIKLMELELSESISTLVAQKLGVTVQCNRCKNHCDVVSPPRRLNSARCGKCQHQQLITFRQSLVHQFASTLGFLDLEGCTSFDLILSECAFTVGCLNCSEESKVQGLLSGQIRTLWCEHCHAKMAIKMQTARFQHLQVQAPLVQGSDKAHVIAVKQIRKQVHPDIHEGNPLPKQGTCKHYKKSFRWLRFPCCGKCYPCDECHDENEPDHEMKYANRMICGFCCKEQQFSPDKPCISCNSSTTKGRTSHWEGGLGCRNQTKMSKTDKQKYSNKSKTVSRKQQNKESDKKAK